MMSSALCGLLVALGFAVLAQGEEACTADTGGSCALLGCHANRGPTVCTKVSFFERKCLCQPGYCAHLGVCKPQEAAGPTPAPLPQPSQGICDQAYANGCYANGCYAKPPFKSCCHEGQCQGGHDELTCNWGFEMPCCKGIFDTSFTNFKFDVGSETACETACNALGDTSNGYLDYCPGGKLLAAVSGCPAAQKSLDKAFGTKSWCSSHHVMTCDWTYAFFSKEASKQLTASASFDFQESNDECVTACGALGLGSNKPEWYCPDSPLAKTISTCPAAKASLNKTHGSWCKTGEVSLVQASGSHEISPAVRELGPAAVRAPVPNRSLRSSPGLSALAEDAGEYDQQCHDAFNQGCWNKKPFTECCTDSCFTASASHNCAWTFNYNGASIGGKLQAFGNEPWGHCDDVCEILKHVVDPLEFCGDKEALKERIKGTECPQAEAQLDGLKAKWCPTPAPQAMPSQPGQPRLGPVAAIMVAAAAAVAAALTVKLRAQRFAGEEGYQPFLE